MESSGVGNGEVTGKRPVGLRECDAARSSEQGYRDSISAVGSMKVKASGSSSESERRAPWMAEIRGSNRRERRVVDPVGPRSGYPLGVLQELPCLAGIAIGSLTS